MKQLLTLFFCFAVVAATAQTTPTRATYAIPGVNSTTQTLLNLTQPYKKIITNVTQSSTSAPVDTALEDNQATAHTWHYIKAGDYRIKCSSCFDIAGSNATQVFTGNTVAGVNIRAWVISADSIGVQTFDSLRTLGNGLMTRTPFEIRMYP